MCRDGKECKDFLIEEGFFFKSAIMYMPWLYEGEPSKGNAWRWS